MLLALLVALLGVTGAVEQPRDQTDMKEFPKKAVADIEKLGGKVTVNEREVVGVELRKATYSNLASLRSFSGLRDLDLAGTDMTDQDLAKLRGFTNLRSLNLGSTWVTDVGLKELGKFKRLRGLNLNNTRVTFAGLTELSGLIQLRRLFLYDTTAPDKGAAALKKALPKLRIYH
jgi:hypothetical protein